MNQKSNHNIQIEIKKLTLTPGYKININSEGINMGLLKKYINDNT